jgi:hypothetical protein
MVALMIGPTHRRNRQGVVVGASGLTSPCFKTASVAFATPPADTRDCLLAPGQSYGKHSVPHTPSSWAKHSRNWRRSCGFHQG